MQRRTLAPLAAAVFLVPAEQAFAQNDPTIVRVALLDVTAIGGHGPEPGGRGMMGGWGAGRSFQLPRP